MDLTEREVQNLLVREARLLDEWKLKEWMELLTPDVRNLVPSLDSPASEPETALFLVSDNAVTLRSRVEQLLGRTAWAENPRSRTRRLVTNVEVLETTGDTARIGANFAVWRFQLGQTDVYVGRYVHIVTRVDGELRFRERRAILDMESLRPHGKLSFIL
ncbi:aromatic-ring-hydroxylating dioxygenase subunit beta [Hydrogenophaga sp.]|uniref:aromatic-ring-hydroxylating dioxygenase subunit beta n=1 Tax=Hydrogenophaga sp. TaxID=1904254 RepID=UPI003F71EA0A